MNSGGQGWGLGIDPTRYEREARLNPVLLALIPPFGVVVGLYEVELQLNATLMGAAATFGVFSRLASIVREPGRRAAKPILLSPLARQPS
jgi:hypothetical protein